VALARTRSVTLLGVTGVTVEVEADLGNGLPGFTIVGLPDTSLNESRDRVRAAVVNSGEQWPQRRITVGLSPASVQKRGSSFDLAVACAVLAAAGSVPPDQVEGLVLLGELGLDGSVRAVRGVLPSVLAAAAHGACRVVVPEHNLAEACLVPHVEAIGVRSLGQLLGHLRGEPCDAPDLSAGQAGGDPDDPGTALPRPRMDGTADHDPGGAPVPGLVLVGGGDDRRSAAPEAVAPARVGAAGGSGARMNVTARTEDPGLADPGARLSRVADAPDLADVRGQVVARRALEVCAAGGHHIFLHGAPGAGKTMLAERLPGLLPPLDRETALEVTAVHSVAGLLPPERPLVTRPPFSAPHHTASLASLVGGGSHQLRPGAVSIAHRGVLFMDEAPEFPRGTLDALRQPLESGEVVITRLAATARFPARFMLVLGANPCPCGLAVGKGTECRCSPMTRRRYLARLSGPLLDRIDVRVEVLPPSRADLLDSTAGSESTAEVAQRVLAARERMTSRLAQTPWRTNAEIPGRELRSRWRPTAGALHPASLAMDRGGLTARGLDRVLRVAWTIADLECRERPNREDVSAALFYRMSAGGTVSS
jgi:magnesium chelatase family protein